MRFWPFGKEKEQADDVEFTSRVVTGQARDGVDVRAKLTLHFVDPVSHATADELVDASAAFLRGVFTRSDHAAAHVGTEAALAQSCLAAAGSSSIRSVDVVALHLIGESPEESRPVSSAPPPTPTPPPPRPGPRRTSSSSQMLAVRDSRLIPEGSTPQMAATAIVPLLRDAATRVLVGTLRAYDLLLVRGVQVEGTSPDDLGELVPVSTAAPGRFADERRPELLRWHDKLGEDVLGALRNEASAVVCFFLHVSLERAGVDTASATALLEAAAHSAFSEEAPLSSTPRYLGVAGDPTDALASKCLDIVGGQRNALASFSLVLTPVLASLQEDFAFTSSQIKISLS